MSERNNPTSQPLDKRIEQLRDAAAPHASKALGFAANKAAQLSAWLAERQTAIDNHTMTPEQEEERDQIMDKAPQTD